MNNDSRLGRKLPLMSEDQISRSATSVRGAQFARLFTVAKVIHHLRFPTSIVVVREKVNERLGMSYSYRTIARDLDLLEYLGAVRRVDRKRWKWAAEGDLLSAFSPEDMRAAASVAAVAASPQHFDC